MVINGIASAVNLSPSDRLKSPAENQTEQNFLTSLLSVAGGSSKPQDVPSVSAGQGKEFTFWLKDEKVAHKDEKLRTKDDALAEIDKIIRQIKKEK